MSIFSHVADLSKIARRDGLGSAFEMLGHGVRWRLMSIPDRKRERKFGLDTRGCVVLDDLNIKAANKNDGFCYVASPSVLIDTFLHNLQGTFDGFSFVDMGSGKGRVLLQASQHAFKEVIGVEFSKELHEIACENISRFDDATRSCNSLMSLNIDAAEFEIPENDCVLYFNNPFNENVMSKVIANLESSYRRTSQQIYVLYQQLNDDLEDDPTDNLSLLSDAGFLVEREVSFRSLLDRFLLKPYKMKIFETDRA